MTQPQVSVGIMRAPSVRYELHGAYERIEKHGDTVFRPLSSDSCFTLHDVTIGIGFHWQREEDQRFAGQLVLRREPDGTVQVINRLPVEEYLCSVISSEMKATAPKAFLQASAVISRSWLLSQMKHRGPAATTSEHEKMDGQADSDACIGGSSKPLFRRLKWYDKQDHIGFDVCSDDHCQRYQGITRVATPSVREAVLATAGQVLWDGEDICDARFGKCCGGVTELFSTCWQDADLPYLASVHDVADSSVHSLWGDLTDEATARAWIQASPPAFCNVEGQRILSLILNNYDLGTREFFRWHVAYSRQELSLLVKKRAGLDLGQILHVEPLQRGPSGRIRLLRIEGSKASMTVGKELEIRRILSETHLYSSAFYVEETTDGFILHGAGWGHGVGMGQIGAAVMGERGYAYTDILRHYYPGALLHKLY